MKDFIKNYIDVFDKMGTTTEEKIDCAIDIMGVLQEKQPDQVMQHIVKPLLIEYRDTEDNATIEDIEELFNTLLNLIIEEK